jgi:arylsulfatase A-like enzyme
MRRLGLMIVCLVAAVAVAFAVVRRRGPAAPRNVVLISIDTLNQRALRAFDASAVPQWNLDAFAERSVRFTKAYSAAPWTLPSHASLFTGLYPDRHGDTDYRCTMKPEIATLASVLRERGFETLAFTEGTFLDRRYGFDRGFDRYDANGASGDPPLSLPRNGSKPNKVGEDPFDRGIAVLQQRADSKRPFFLFLHTYAVHNYTNLTPWAAADIPRAELRTTKQYTECLHDANLCSARDREVLAQLYSRELSHLDPQFGGFLAALDESGLRRSTLVIVVSDHGEGFDAQHARIHHGGRLNEDQLRVPVMFSAPGLEAQTIDAPISLVDVMPTTLALLGVDPPQGIDGRSFADAVRGGSAAAPRPLYAMEFFFFWDGGKRFETPSVREDPLSLAVIDDGKTYITDRSGEQLYDIDSDPDQRRDLAATSPMPEAFRRLALERRQAKPERVAQREEMERAEQLRALGYVQ